MASPRNGTPAGVMSHDQHAINGNAAKNETGDDTSTGSITTARKNAPPGKSGGGVSRMSQLLKLRAASRRPLPTEMGDGTYRSVRVRPSLMKDLRSLTFQDLKTIKAILAAKIKGETQTDDKTMIMERTIQLVAGLPDYSRRQELLTNDFIDKLWYSLEHPPLLYVGDQYRFRQPDGSNNNPTLPRLGAAGTPYSRSCKPRGVGLAALPAPDTIFESIMARDTFKKNPNNVSSILWCWATIVIHDLFNTSPADGNINNNSSYLDLSPLYGNSQKAQDSIRTFQHGRLKPDAFADKRLLGNPPAVCILLVMFNRFHNHVAENLAAINEDNRFAKPSPDLPSDKAEAAWRAYDEELFQTARLVTSGLYINIVLVDYVRNIINLNRVDTAWTLDPRQEMGTAAGTRQGAQSGVGNAVSAEFNLCYRWHSCISERDEAWMQDFFAQLLGPSDERDFDLAALMTAMKRFEMTLPEDPGDCTFGGFSRGPDGRFADDELAEALSRAVEEPGGAFGARNVPRVMKPVEALGILRGRRWHTASLNEFRKQFGLRAHGSFEDINSDPRVADQLRSLYQHPDNVELYAGIVAEEAKQPMVPGVGIAPTYTISRVVLSDAVALVRGDRHYTTDYHAGALTNWGLKEVDYGLGINHGCVFYKLFIRAFPNHFRENSVYAHYPMVTPLENRKILANMGRDGWFNFDRPQRGQGTSKISSHKAFEHVMANPATYGVPWEHGLGCSVNQDPAPQGGSLDELLLGQEWKTAARKFYAETAEALFAQKACRIAGQTQIDLVRDVGNLAHTHFVSRVFSLPLKTQAHPKGVFSEQEMYKSLAVINASVFRDTDPVQSFALRRTAVQASKELGSVIETNIKLSLAFGMTGLYVQKFKNDTLSQYGFRLAKELAKSGLDAHAIAWRHVLPAAAATVPDQAQMFAKAADWYLSTAGEPYRAEVDRIAAQEPTDATDALLLGYAMEGLRMAESPSLFRTVRSSDVIEDDAGNRVHVAPGSTVLVSAPSSTTDDTDLPHPEKLDPKRPLNSYAKYGVGTEPGPARGTAQIGLVALFRALFRRSNVRRVPGQQGELKRFFREDGEQAFMNEEYSAVSPFPVSMKVSWDGE